MTAKRKTTVWLFLVLVLTCLAYWPGLSGGYLFDDFVNLNAIGATGPVDNWDAFLRYITSGTADPTGRPIALLSFLIDARDWPADPASFLRTNLLLHLMNGALLFVLLRSLGRHLDGEDPRSDAAALLGSALWLLHPLFVSTTLYIVQREAMLPATFILLGLLAYVRGRRVYAQDRQREGAGWMAAGILGGTGLALLCKGNGIVLPLLAWVLEATVLQSKDPVPPDPGLRRIRFALLAIPSLALLVYLASFLQILHVPLERRGWTVAQRLLTEPRVISDYLHLLVMPRSVSTGLYNDSYEVSKSLLQPASTLPCLVLVVAIAVFSWRARRKLPILSAALLFFLAGHALESTSIPLELYFEHRNYLPALLLFWPLARGISSLRIEAHWRAAIALGLLLLFAATTFQRARLWGHPDQLAALWALQNPGSSRAQATAAMLETSAGNPQSALKRLRPIWKRNPEDLQIAFNYVNAACAFNGLAAEDSRALESALRSSTAGLPLIHGWLGQAIEMADSGQCPGLDLAHTDRWLSAVLHNPQMKRSGLIGQDVEPLLAQLAISRKQPDKALAHFNRALAAFVTPDAAARQASTLARNGYFRQALAHLDTYEALKGQVARPGLGMPWVHFRVLRHQDYWPREMAALRSKLQAEIRGSSQDAPAATLAQP